MNEFAPILDRISGYFFLMGLITSKLKKIPIFVLSCCLNAASLATYLIGYMTWYLAALFYPNHPRKQESWYGFAKPKHQFQASALLGIIATILCIISPPLIIPATWLYFVSNFLWTMGVYHKNAKPPLQDEKYSSAKQNVYFQYTVFVTVASAIAAIAATAVILYPSAAIYIATYSSIIATGLTIAALLYLAKYTFCHFPTDTIRHTYDILSNHLSIAPNHVKQLTDSPGLELNQQACKTGRFFDTLPKAPNNPCKEGQAYENACQRI